MCVSVCLFDDDGDLCCSSSHFYSNCLLHRAFSFALNSIVCLERIKKKTSRKKKCLFDLLFIITTKRSVCGIFFQAATTSMTWK